MSTSELPESEYDKEWDFYYDYIIRNGPSVGQTEEAVLQMLGDIDGARVCDLACGEGYLARELAKRGAVVTGVDLSVKLLHHAERQSVGLGINYIRDDAQRLDKFDDRTFDAIVCYMALMDIPGLDATIRTVWRILENNGLFVFLILHPCFRAPFSVDNPHQEFDEEGNLIALRVTRYSEEGKWYSGGSGMCGTFGSHHRMISTYLNALAHNGFRVEDVHEPRRGIVPVHLIVKSRKTDS